MTQAGHSERMEMALPGPVVSPSPPETKVAAPRPSTLRPPSRRRASGVQWRGVSGGLPSPLTPPQLLGTAPSDPSGYRVRHPGDTPPQEDE